MAIPKDQIGRLIKCYLAILCAYIETQNPDVTMEVEIVAVYYGMSVYHSLKSLRYVRIVAARSRRAVLAYNIASSNIAEARFETRRCVNMRLRPPARVGAYSVPPGPPAGFGGRGQNRKGHGKG